MQESRNSILRLSRYRRCLLDFRNLGYVRVFSDNLGEALKGLVYYGHEVTALHVVDPLESDPGLAGELDVEDAETGELVPVTVKGDTVRRYREAFEKRCHAVASACATFDAKYVRVSTTDAVENTVLRRLRREGMVE